MITHRGIITKISDDRVTVSISSDSSECSGCAISAMCMKSEEIEISYPHPTLSLIGKKVRVEAQAGLQRKGTLLFFIIPILLLIFTIMLSYAIGMSEALSSAISTAAVALWYLILYIIRVRINSNVGFRIID